MAGHSKWANIRHRKGAQDVKRGKIFTKLIREISIATRQNGGDLNNNPRLRSAIDKALSANMKRDNIDQAIKKATGNLTDIDYVAVRYEGYGPGGTAIIVACLTDNRNRTTAQVRHAFAQSGGNLGTDGSVAYMFNKIGIISYGNTVDEHAILEVAIEAGADDVITHNNGSLDVNTNTKNYMAVKKAMLVAGFVPEHAEVTMQATTTVELTLANAEKMLRLIDNLDGLDDVQDVYTNADISQETMAQLT